MSASALYEGWVAHSRRDPVEHAFRYPVWMLFLDLEELPHALDRHPLWSARRPAPVRIRRRDHLPDREGPLADAARELVAGRLGFRPAGPVRLLTMPRVAGIGFNPVSFHYLFDERGSNVEAVIAEVTSTPWGERHSYVLDGRSGSLEGEFTKHLHVSPFMPMEQTYRWRLSEPQEELSVAITSEQRGAQVFSAGLALRRRELTRGSMTRAMVAHPPAAAGTLARIYWNALRLKLKGAPYHPRPASG